MLRRLVPIVAFLLFLGLVAASAVGPVAAQEGTDRTPITLEFFMSDTATENGTEGAPAGATFQLVNGTSGSSPSVNSGCAPQGQPQMTMIAEWMSAPAWPYRTTVMNVSSVTLGVGPGPSIQPPVPAPPQPVTTGNVNIQLRLAAGEDGSHDIATANREIVAAGDPTATQMPGSILMEFNEPSSGAHPENMPLVLQLSVSCDNAASFSVSGGAITLEILYGSPTDPDTDGDGIPDPIDPDADGDGFTDEVEEQVGADPRDASVTPQSTSANCPGYTYQEVIDETGDPNQCPAEGGFPWLLVVLVLLAVILLAGGGAGAFIVVNKKIKMTVSHDGFQAIEKGQSAEYELTLMATGKKEEEIPVELTLKGVPEDWSASLEPSHMTLFAGEATEAQTAILRLTPPPGEEYESEAQVVVTATPTDAEGKTSAMKPGTSVKTKSIVNIGVTPPEGEGKKKPKKEKAPVEEGAAEEEEGGKKKLALGGLLKRKKKDEDEEEAEAEAEEKTAETATEPPAAGAAAAEPTPSQGKPSVAMGKMTHEPADFSAGDDVTTTVTVRNKGDGPVEGLTLSLYVNDQRADQRSVDLGPGDSEDVTFHWTARPDENRVRLKGSMKGA